ncbi:hypothetical protein [Streptacidiphilus monticola]|uniref:Uncharacterized protein n=1 Tax=Streptacidiphilus monticola TaxID=2161674 RepID=A0ABW1G7C9_9ACTN
MSRTPAVRVGTDLYWSGSEAAFRAAAEQVREALPATEEGLRAEVEAAASFGWLAPVDLPEPERSTLLRALGRAGTAPQEPSVAGELDLLRRMAEQALRETEAS